MSFLFFLFVTHAEVIPPTQQFKLEQLRPYYPGNNFEDKKKALFIRETKAKTQIYQLIIKHEIYTFPIYIQVLDKKILDLYATLPTYFLHDVLLQTLINRFGKQKKSFKKEETRLYLWKETEYTIYYRGSCTITCWPQYLTLIPTKTTLGKKYIPLLEQLRVN